MGYLNFDKIIEKENIIRAGRAKASYEYLPIKFQEALNIVEPDKDLPYVSGYKGFKMGVKSNSLYGANTRELALQARNEAKLRKSFQ